MTPFSFPVSWSISLILMLAWGGVGYYAGDYNRNNAWLAKQAVVERQAREALQQAQARGDALSTGLLNQQSEINQLKEEKRDAIVQATTGKPCLHAPALRVLGSAPGITVSGLSPATGSAVAAGEPFATDSDIALWVIEAGARFEVCRARLDALIDWNTHDD